MSPLARLLSVFFGLGVEYDSGVDPSVAVNATQVVVEVHEAMIKTGLWYRVGMTQEMTVDWGPGTQYDSGVTPAVAMNIFGTVVELHKTQNPLSTQLYYRVGTVDTAKRSIQFGPSVAFDNGRVPSVAMTGQGVVVEVHETSGSDSKLWYHVGRINGDKIQWGPSRDYDNGQTPSVSVIDDGTVVEVHKSQGPDTLWYHLGKINGDKIDWQPSVKYQDGVQPAVALNPDGTVVEVHKSEGASNALWQMTGRVQGDRIGWTANAAQFDTGQRPSVSIHGGKAIQVHQSEDLRTLYYSNALLDDRANWMGSRFETMKDKTLRQIAMPASHDAGMYAGGLAGRTQDQSLYNQLRSGVRYFDLRPATQYAKPLRPGLIIAHGVVEGPPVAEVLGDVKRFMQEGHRELVILKFSHYGGSFNRAEYDTLLELISSNLGTWLFKSKTWTGRLGDARISDLIGEGGKVLVVCDGPFPLQVPTAGIYVYRDWESDDPDKGDLTVFDQYADVLDLSTMALDQWYKFATFDGKCRKNPAVPCDLFLLSWTLTPPTGVALASQPANRALGDFMVKMVKAHQTPNHAGLIPNLLYVDYVEYSRVADVVIEANARP
jgi:hypothetical protein